ncbi:MAG: toll/interleukin-1 receptor domain-containing protein [Terracidiphilus sp.]
MLIQLETQYAKPKPRSVFYSYSHKDEDLRDELDTHLKLLKREGFISTWHDRKISPGNEWDHVINESLNTAEVILFLVSQNFLASEYCRDIEMRRAMERYEKREAIVIPIILKPCVWTSEPFAKLQALPKNCRPLVEWPDTGFARESEELRAMMVNLIYPRLPSVKNEGHHGQWVMKLRSRPGVDRETHARQVVARLREFTEDFTINLLATASTQIADGEKIAMGLMLILTGTPEAFSKISAAQDKGHLVEEVDNGIVSFYAILGATVQGSSTVGGAVDIPNIEDEDLVLRPGRKVETAKLVGLLLPEAEQEEANLSFVTDLGNTASKGDDARRAEDQTLSEYFYTSLVLKNELQWVNLSAYESDRMLPPELSGTSMGKNLLSQDCMLKRLTASFMHPDSPIGREYWNAVYAEARRLFGTSKLPFRSFQKVWVRASKADVYSGTRSRDKLMTGLTASFPPNATFAFLVASDLEVVCEEDLVAKCHGNGTGCDTSGTDFTLDLFRKIVLPRLKEEVNGGEHFAEIRKIYSAEILATWLKKSQQVIKSEKLRKFVNCGDTTAKVVLRSVVPLLPDKGAAVQVAAGPSVAEKKEHAGPVEHATPHAPAFKISENVEYFAQYVRLFKDGVFRCARSETGDAPDERVIRVYFSGAIDFRNLPDVIKVVER